MNTNNCIHNGNTFDAIALPTIFSVKIEERFRKVGNSHYQLLIRLADDVPGDAIRAAIDAAIKKTYGENSVLMIDHGLSTAAVTVGQLGYRLPQKQGGGLSMVSGRFFIEVEQKPSSVTIGNTTFTTNRTSRSVEAVSAIAKAKAIIEANGYLIDTKGPAAGNDGVFKVYVYPVESMHRIGDKNSIVDATCAFSVQYMKGRWFASATALAEAMAKGLRGFSDYLEEADAYDAGFAAYRTSMSDLDAIQSRA